jgi:hypothetical protein
MTEIPGYKVVNGGIINSTTGQLSATARELDNSDGLTVSPIVTRADTLWADSSSDNNIG